VITLDKVDNFNRVEDNNDQRDHVTTTERRFGAKVREAREAQGKSQKHVALEISALYGMNWHQTTVAKTEAAERPIRLNEAAALAQVLGRPLTDLLGESPDDLDQHVRVAQQAAALREIRLMTAHLRRREQEVTKGDQQ
jgi:transcriptional regulator with XRE-family HTH domain